MAKRIIYYYIYNLLSVMKSILLYVFIISMIGSSVLLFISYQVYSDQGVETIYVNSRPNNDLLTTEEIVDMYSHQDVLDLLSRVDLNEIEGYTVTNSLTNMLLLEDYDFDFELDSSMLEMSQEELEAKKPKQFLGMMTPIIFDNEYHFTSGDHEIVEGTFLNKESKQNGIIISKSVAEANDIKIGDVYYENTSVNLYNRLTGNANKSDEELADEYLIPLEVVGIYENKSSNKKTEDYEYGETFYITDEKLEEIGTTHKYLDRAIDYLDDQELRTKYSMLDYLVADIEEENNEYFGSIYLRVMVACSDLVCAEKYEDVFKKFNIEKEFDQSFDVINSTKFIEAADEPMLRFRNITIFAVIGFALFGIIAIAIQTILQFYERNQEFITLSSSGLKKSAIFQQLIVEDLIKVIIGIIPSIFIVKKLSEWIAGILAILREMSLNQSTTTIDRIFAEITGIQDYSGIETITIEVAEISLLLPILFAIFMTVVAVFIVKMIIFKRYNKNQKDFE